MHKFTIITKKKKEIVDITSLVNDIINKNSYNQGVCILFTLHTTCCLTVADLDPGGTEEDYISFFEKMVPKLKFKHPHNPSHVPDHIISSIIGMSLAIPVSSGSMVLGDWQRIVLIEFSGPRQRQICLNFITEKS